MHVQEDPTSQLGYLVSEEGLSETPCLKRWYMNCKGLCLHRHMHRKQSHPYTTHKDKQEAGKSERYSESSEGKAVPFHSLTLQVILCGDTAPQGTCTLTLFQERLVTLMDLWLLCKGSWMIMQMIQLQP